MAMDITQAQKGMQVRSSDGADVGKVAEVWLGTDPRHSGELCDEELCSRLEVHKGGLLGRSVLYVPYSAVSEVSDGTVTLNVDEATVESKNWAHKPAWIEA